MRKALFLPFVAALAIPLLPATEALADTSGCGATITKNLVLTHDLTCSGNAIVVGAPGLTINLNGHTLGGSGSAAGIETIQTGQLDLTVKNGTIKGFDSGVHLASGGTFTFTGLHLTSNTNGVLADSGGVNVNVSNTYFTSNTTGIGTTISSGTGTVVVQRSDFNTNGTAIFGASNDVTVKQSNFMGNQSAIRAFDASLSVSNSSFVKNPAAIYAELEGVTLTGNAFWRNDVAISVDSDLFGLLIKGNTLAASGLGIAVTGPSGGAVSSIDSNVVTGGKASGIYVDLAGGALSVSRNTVTGNGFSPGAYTDSSGTPLKSGITANGAKLTGNIAIGNSGHGVNATFATDGHGNIALANGTSPQCVGVVCTTH
jgi:hypothetical protein